MKKFGLISDFGKHSARSEMTAEEKIRLGMLAISIGGTALVFWALGLTIGPLEAIGGGATG